MSVSRNTAYNLLGSAIPLAVSLVTIPIYLGLIGEARYGVLAISWLLLGYFGLFDLGLGRATAQRIAALRDSTTSERAETFWTALALNVVLGVMGGLLIWPIVAYFFGNAFNVEDSLRTEVQAAVPWLVMAVPTATLSGVLGGALQGRERFLEMNLISVAGTVLFQLLPLVTALVWGADLSVLLPAAIIARLFTLLMLFDRCRRCIFEGHDVRFAKAQVGQLLRFGGWVTVTSFIGPMMVILDRFIIGALAGARAVAYYTVPFQLAERSTIISGALSSALFPRMAVASPQDAKLLALEALRTLVVVMTPIVAGGVLLMAPFLSWWITPAFAAQSSLVGEIILLGFWANSLAVIPYAQLQARGRPELVAKCHLAELLPYFALLYFSLSIFGMAGAAIAFTVRALSDFALLAGYSGVLRPSFRSLLIPAILLVSALLIATLTTPGKLIWWAFAIAHLLTTAVWAWNQAPGNLRAFFLTRLKPLTAILARKRRIHDQAEYRRDASK